MERICREGGGGRRDGGIRGCKKEVHGKSRRFLADGRNVYKMIMLERVFWQGKKA
jgi:hypothetical protein